MTTNLGGRRIVPRWTKQTINPPSNLESGEIASSLTGEALFVGRPPAAPLVLRPGVSQQQLDQAIATIATGFNHVGAAGLSSTIQEGDRWLETEPLRLWQYTQGEWLSPPISVVLGGATLTANGSVVPLAFAPPWEGRILLERIICVCQASTAIAAGNVSLIAEVLVASQIAYQITGTPILNLGSRVANEIFVANLSSANGTVLTNVNRADPFVQSRVRAQMTVTRTVIVRGVTLVYREVR